MRTLSGRLHLQRKHCHEKIDLYKRVRGEIYCHFSPLPLTCWWVSVLAAPLFFSPAIPTDPDPAAVLLP